MNRVVVCCKYASDDTLGSIAITKRFVESLEGMVSKPNDEWVPGESNRLWENKMQVCDNKLAAIQSLVSIEFYYDSPHTKLKVLQSYCFTQVL